VIGWIKRKLAARAAKRNKKLALVLAERGAKALDIMLDGSDWYGGCGVSSVGTVHISVLVVGMVPGKISAFVPPHIGSIPVLVTFKDMEDPLPEEKSSERGAA
jgi:hypothetical protein